MSSLIKYRVHEVAKDFNLGTKEITDILTKYAKTPKNHMQVLEDGELAILFDYLTQHHPVDSIESIYADVYREPKPAQKPAARSVTSGSSPRRGGRSSTPRISKAKMTMQTTARRSDRRRRHTRLPPPIAHPRVHEAVDHIQQQAG